MMTNKNLLYVVLISIILVVAATVLVLNRPSSIPPQKGENTETTIPDENILFKKGIVIITDKDEYDQGEVVKILVKNNLEEMIFIPPYYSISIQEKLDDGTWNSLTLGPPPPPYMPNLEFDYIKINNGDSHDFTWDQKIFKQQGKRFLVDEGVFRTFVRYVNESTAKNLGYPNKKGILPQEGDFLIVYSKEFTIK